MGNSAASTRAWRHRHPEENRRRAKLGRDTQPDKTRATLAAWRKRHPERLLELHRISYVQVKAKREAQQVFIAGRLRPDACELCGQFGPVHFDHDHTTGDFRGWLCPNCNCALGLAKDSIDLLLKMVDYLTRASMSHDILASISVGKG